MDCKERQQFADFVLDRLADAVYLIRPDGSLVYVNRTACEMLGYSRDELLAKTMFDINPTMDPDRWAQVWEAFLEQGGRSFQSLHRTRSGSVLTVDIVSHILELNGEKHSCAIARDVSAIRPVEEERQREHMFVESLIEMAPVLVVLLDGDGNVLRVNRATEALTGYSRDEVRGRNWIDTFVPEPERAKVHLLVRQSLGGEAMRGNVYPIVTKSGAVREVVWNDQLVSRADGAGTGLLSIGQDVTEQRELEQRLRQAEKMEAVGMLAGGIAHDFNNQLAGIMGWAEILGIQAEKNPELREGVERIIVASKRARDVVAQLLAYSRKGKLVTKDVDVHALVEESVAMLRRGLDPRITIRTDLQAANPHTAGDPSQLGNAVLNLGLNGRDAMPNGGTLTFATRMVTVDPDEAGGSEDTTPGELIELLVKDTGIGMDEATQRRMFEPFFTTKVEGRGTGMGLAAVYGTVKNHRGSIRVSSAVNAGTEVRLRLPVRQGALVGELSRSDSSGALPLQDGRDLSLHVMVVDDEEPVREVAGLMLRRLGCGVATFGSPFDAIDEYARSWKSIDVVVLDMVMPMLDGKSTFYALRKINPRVAVVLVSGYSVEGAAQALLDEGAFAFVQKPFTLTEVREVLERVAKRKRRRGL